MDIRSIVILCISLALSACSLVKTPVTNKIQQTQETVFNCKINQPELLRPPTLLPFENTQVITYEMLVEKRLFSYLRNVEIIVLGENNNSRTFEYSSAKLQEFSQINLETLLSVNGDLVEESHSKKYADQSLIFFRLVIDQTDFSPKSIQHTFNFTKPCQSLQHATQLTSLTPLVLGSPVKGESWNALNEGTSQYSAHRRSVLINKDGSLYIPQHYAIDFSRSRIEWPYYPRILLAALFSNKLDKTYGADVFAVADGEVVALVNNLPEKKALRNQTTEPLSRKALAGNYIIYKMDNDKFAFYAHFQPNSIKVKVGDKIVKGQAIALLGNSGNSTAPHLHFSVNETADLLLSEGVPFVFDIFETENKKYLQQRQKPSSTVKF